jgi:hypothetical protein
MNEFSPWTQGNWYAVGSLLNQLAFLVMGVWFARNLLRAMKVFQEQVGALLKLSITAAPNEQHFSSDSPKHSEDASRYLVRPSTAQTADLPKPTERRPGRLAARWRHLVLWLGAPISSPRPDRWRRVKKWQKQSAPTVKPDADPCNASISSAVPQTVIERPDSDVTLASGQINVRQPHPDQDLEPTEKRGNLVNRGLGKLRDQVSKRSQKSEKDLGLNSEKDSFSPVYSRRWRSTRAQSAD